MIDNLNIKSILKIVTFILTFYSTMGQSTSNNYTNGDISSNYNYYDSNCNGPNTKLIISLPDDSQYTVTKIDKIKLSPIK